MGGEDFKSLIQKLKEALQQALPGEEAQKLMIPRMEPTDRFDKTSMKSARPGGVLILLYQKNNEVFFPLIQRPVYNGAHSGQISLPGGKKEPDDLNIIDTAQRETFEEIGVPSDLIQVIGRLSPLFIPVSNFVIEPVVGYIDKSPQFQLDEREVVRLIEAKILDLQIKAPLEKMINTSSGIQLMAPYFDIEQNVVWGATAMILSEFRQILNNIN